MNIQKSVQGIAAIVLLAARASAQDEELTAIVPRAGHEFGRSIASAALPVTPVQRIVRGFSPIPAHPDADWIVVGSALARTGGLAEAGRVDLIPPPGSFLTPRTVLTAPSGHAQAHAHFGASLAVGDFDADGCIDLAVGAPDFDGPNHADVGRVFLFFGPWEWSAPTPYAAVSILVVDPADLDPGSNTGGRFGLGLAAGPLDAQPGDDLVVGSPLADDWQALPAIRGCGAIEVFLDPPAGQAALLRDQRILEDAPRRADGNHFGWAVDVGQVADPGTPALGEIVVGVPDVDRAVAGGTVLVDAGWVHLLFGHGSLASPIWDNTPGFFQKAGGTLYIQDGRQGSALAFGDYDGDGWDDLAVGSPGSIAADGTFTGPEGYVMIYRSDGSNGLTSAGAVDQPLLFARNPYASDTNLLGISLAWADTDGTGQLDLIVGAPGVGRLFQPARQEGRVLVFHAEAGVLPKDWLQPGFHHPTPQIGQRFGWCVASARRLGDLDEVASGAPHTTVDGKSAAGAATVHQP